MRSGGPKIEAESGDGVLFMGSGSAVSSPVGFGAESRPPKVSTVISAQDGLS